MPTIQIMELPKPKLWQEFEIIVRDAQALRWNSTSLQKNGRPGQRQSGVDIYGPDEIGRPVGIQCKPPARPVRKSATCRRAERQPGRATLMAIRRGVWQEAPAMLHAPVHFARRYRAKCRAGNIGERRDPDNCGASVFVPAAFSCAIHLVFSRPKEIRKFMEETPGVLWWLAITGRNVAFDFLQWRIRGVGDM